MNRMIIGLGTGRCGTMSLTRLLGAQAACVSLHEPKPLLPWITDPVAARRHVRKLSQQPKRVVASTACFYLPYVEWLHTSVGCPITFVCLKRTRQQTIDSFVQWTEVRVPPKRDHWRRHDGTKFTHTEWDKCFPQYDEPSKRRALGRYWDDYYDRAETLADRKLNFRIFPMNMLNHEGGVKEILEFCGFEEPRIRVGVRAHHKPEQA